MMSAELLFKNIFIFWVLYSILDLNFDLTGHGNPTKHTAVSLQMCVCVVRSLNSLRLYVRNNRAVYFIVAVRCNNRVFLNEIRE